MGSTKVKQQFTLKAGFIAPPDFVIHRSGIRWLCENNQFCAAGKIIAYCNIRICESGGTNRLVPTFESESQDLQLAFVLKRSGQINISDNQSSGGFHDQLAWAYPWDPDFVLGKIQCDPLSEQDVSDPLRRMIAAGRRVTDQADIRSGFLSGWHDRVRTWWADSHAIKGSVLGLGTCETTAVFRGPSFSQIELMNVFPQSAHVAVIPDDMRVPCSRVLVEQLHRTQNELEKILTDLTETLPLSSPRSISSDWFTTSLMVSGLRTPSITESHHVFTQNSVQNIGRPDAIVLSMVAEPRELYRHRRLGYSLYMHPFHIQRTNTFKEWLMRNFEPITRSLDDIRSDFCALIDTINSAHATHFLIFNRITTSIQENINNYSYIDGPISKTIRSVAHKESNLMLYDLRADRNVSIVDCDAIASDIGIGQNIPDGIHQSELMQSALRCEILRILKSKNTPGFEGQSNQLEFDRQQ